MVMETQFGEELCITGSAPELGSWNPNVGLKLQWSPGHKWFVRIPFKTFGSKSFEYKYVIKNSSGAQRWEGGQNHFFDFKHFSDMLQSPQVQDFFRVQIKSQGPDQPFKVGNYVLPGSGASVTMLYKKATSTVEINQQW